MLYLDLPPFDKIERERSRNGDFPGDIKNSSKTRDLVLRLALALSSSSSNKESEFESRQAFKKIGSVLKYILTIKIKKK